MREHYCKVNETPNKQEDIVVVNRACPVGCYEDAKKEGIKEVVNWLINYNLHQFPEEYRVLWQSKLKEWGI